MPNHVRNRLIIQADESLVAKILDHLRGEPEEDGSPRHIDFNKIIPLPEAMMIDEGSNGDMGLAILQRTGFAGMTYKDVKKRFDELEPEDKNARLKLGQQYSDNEKKYGHRSWYNWSIANWGTKWNAYNHSKPAPNEIWFDTAWSCVHSLVRRLSQMFPEAVFWYTFADEDTGSNCGEIVLQNGEGMLCVPDDGSKEAYEIAFEMRPDIREYFRFDGKTYHYNE
jgi:hypothetical protein